MFRLKIENFPKPGEGLLDKGLGNLMLVKKNLVQFLSLGWKKFSYWSEKFK
jgi:hypothetical protein